LKQRVSFAADRVTRRTRERGKYRGVSDPAPFEA